nr:hypothetical protein [Tanacetum cinerariifolium]
NQRQSGSTDAEIKKALVHNSSDPALTRQEMASVQNSTDPALTRQEMASVQNSTDPALTKALVHNSSDPALTRQEMASVQNSTDPALTRQAMASVQISSDPAPKCQTMALEHNSLSPGRNCQENVSHRDKTVVSKSSAVSAADAPNQRQQPTTPLNNHSTPTMASVQISSDPAPKCQTMALEHNSLSPGRKCQENVSHGDKTDTTSNELDLLFSPMFNELLNGSSKVVSKSSTVSAVDAPYQQPHAENNEVADDEFINIFSTSVQDQGETSSRHVDSSNMHTFYQCYPS